MCACEPGYTGALGIDYRIYDPQGDGTSKLDHVREVQTNVVHHIGLARSTVLMDTRYATKELMLFIESLDKIYCCLLKSHHLVDGSGGELEYRRVDSLSWNAREAAHGKIVKIRGFLKEQKVKLFRVAVSTHRTGIESCQCRKARMQRNQNACAILVWVRLAAAAKQAGETMYRIKHGLPNAFLRQQLKNSTTAIRLA